MARRPTQSESFRLRQLFPALDMSNVWVLSEATSTFNCLAWALGITSRWVWPWGSRNATDAEMTAFLRTYGYRQGSSGTVVSYGWSASAVGHAARYYNSSWGWTSKLGAWILINHPRDGLMGGYGARRLFYARTGITEAVELENAEMIEPGNDELGPVADDDRTILDRLVSATPDDVSTQYAAAFAQWTEAINESAVADSSTYGFTQLPGYGELVALGPTALPLLMADMAEPASWYAVLVADVLLPIEQQLVVDLDDEEAVLGGEQLRARRTLEMWLHGQT